MIDPSWIAGLGVILFGVGLLGTFYPMIASNTSTSKQKPEKK